MKKISAIILGLSLATTLVACNEKDNQANENAEPNKNNIPSHESEDHDHEDLHYEWAGSFDLDAGTYSLQFKQNQYGDESILLAFILENSNITDLEHHADHIMSAGDASDFAENQLFNAESEYAYNLLLNTEGATGFQFTISEPGTYRIFTEHHADEFEMEITDESGTVIPAQNPEEYEGHEH